LEEDFHDYLDKMMLLMEEMKRVLKPTGTCWINLGDTYAGGRAHSDWSGVDERFKSNAMKNGKFSSIKKNHIEAKSQYGIPQRFYALCIDDGWLARNWVTWVKPNSMPFSGTDRLKNSTEPVMFFAKDQKYYFDLDPVRTKEHPAFFGKVKKIKDKSGQTSLVDHDDHVENKSIIPKKQDNTVRANGKPDPTKVGFNDRWKEKTRKWQEEGFNTSTSHTLSSRNSGGFDRETGEYLGNPNGANPGDVFTISTNPTKEAHFATFPVELPKTILRMACPTQVCKECGKPREKILESNNPSKEDADYENDMDFSSISQKTSNPQSSKSLHRNGNGVYSTSKTIGYTKCSCEAEFEVGIVLDPFFGSGTTGIAAEELGLRWIGIELNPAYVTMSRNRLSPYMNAKL
jgi:DNA modification methylase